MELDNRCCGTGTCIINKDGECWCGQKWDGEKMCFPALQPPQDLHVAQDDPKKAEQS